MSTPFQGTSGPNGLAGLPPAFGQPAVSGNHVAPDSALISSQQILPEQSHQLRKLIVRLLIDVFNLEANNMPDGTSNLSKRYGHNMPRYDPAPLTKRPPDHLEGILRDKGTDRRFGEKFG